MPYSGAAPLTSSTTSSSFFDQSLTTPKMFLATTASVPVVAAGAQMLSMLDDAEDEDDCGLAEPESLGLELSHTHDAGLARPLPLRRLDRVAETEELDDDVPRPTPDHNGHRVSRSLLSATLGFVSPVSPHGKAASGYARSSAVPSMPSSPLLASIVSRPPLVGTGLTPQPQRQLQIPLPPSHAHAQAHASPKPLTRPHAMGGGVLAATADRMGQPWPLPLSLPASPAYNGQSVASFSLLPPFSLQ